MDSGNSGSMQSSSGGDEEYDSRAESSLSAFMNNNATNTNNNNNNNNNHPLAHLLPLQHSQAHHHFESLSNYFDPLSSSRSPPPLANPNSLLNLDMVWSKNLRSDPSCTDLGGAAAFLAASSQTRPATPTTFPSVQIPPQAGASNDQLISSNNDTRSNSSTSNINNSMARNPKKRSRASRRAPTTVLTTDTANFRAMVQEFTGIPAPPFTSSPFPRSRLDLFGTAATACALRSAATHLDPAPPYLLRPFAQKIHPPPLPQQSSIVDAITSTTTATNNNNSTNANANSSFHLGLLNSNILNFHPLIQQPPILGGVSTTTKALPSQNIVNNINNSNNNHNLKMGVLEEFGLNQQSLTGLQNMPSSSVPENTAMRRSDQQTNRRDGSLINNSQIMNGKANYAAVASSSGDFHHGEKGPTENVSTRSEGMLESWICSSD